MVDHIALRRMRVKAAREIATHTNEEWQQLKAKYGCCLRCGCKHRELAKDHVRAVADGGSDGIDNLQPLCFTCNTSKLDFFADYRNALEVGFERMCKCDGCFPTLQIINKSYRAKVLNALSMMQQADAELSRQYRSIPQKYINSVEARKTAERMKEIQLAIAELYRVKSI